jgi:hypothetical protein
MLATLPLAMVAAFDHFMRVGRLAHDFQATLDTVNRLADQALAVVVNCVARGGGVHLHDVFPSPD